MTRSFFHRLRRDEGGSVITEFAIWTSALFIVIMTALDFGGYYIARSSINEAISAAAVQAFQKREDAPFATLPAYVRNLADDQSLTVELTCNGSETPCTNDADRRCACLKTDATYVGQSCGSACGSGMTEASVAGYYLTIKASRPYQPLLVPQGMLSDKALDQSTTVRLQ